MPTLNPVGHQSTNWIVRFVLIVAMAALTSFGTTSPRYSMQQAMYLPWRGSHLTIWFAGSKQALLLVVRLLGRDDRGVGDQREVDTRVRHQVGLELGQIHVEGTVEAERRRDGRHNLADQSVEIRVGRALDVQVATADVVDGLVVDHERAVGMLQGGVGGQDGVVRLDHGRRHLRGRVDGELELRLLAIIHRQTLHQQRGEAGTGTATERVEDQETLQPGALVRQLADAVQHQIDDLLADGVMATGVVVRRILLAGDQLLRVEQLAVRAGAYLIHDRRLQIDEHGTGHMLAGSGLREEGVERIVTTADRLVRRHLAVRLDAMLETVQLPAGVTDLDTGLSDVYGNALTLMEETRERSDWEALRLSLRIRFSSHSRVFRSRSSRWIFSSTGT
uniref:Uncharacterized protein n=1 Tax=Anopheles coluzzii TaxID=1518534 RepID=A0A8W7P101_ANOCL